MYCKHNGEQKNKASRVYSILSRWFIMHPLFLSGRGGSNVCNDFEEINVLYPAVSRFLIIVLFWNFLGFSGEDEGCSEESGESRPAMILYQIIPPVCIVICSIFSLYPTKSMFDVFFLFFFFLYVSMFTIK